MEDRIPNELIARIKRFVPKGKITIIEMEPLAGQELRSISFDEVRSAAPKDETMDWIRTHHRKAA